LQLKKPTFKHLRGILGFLKKSVIDKHISGDLSSSTLFQLEVLSFETGLGALLNPLSQVKLVVQTK